jgi:hypothetical protein
MPLFQCLGCTQGPCLICNLHPEFAQPYVGLSGGDALITIIFPTVGTVTLDLNDETNLDIAETILKKIKEKIKKRDANLTPPCFPPKEISEPNLTS